MAKKEGQEKKATKECQKKSLRTKKGGIVMDREAYRRRMPMFLSLE
jgi:hypothetical protein